jgi:hypothetical protein
MGEPHLGNRTHHQPIFEPFKDGLKGPAEVLRRFFNPLIREAKAKRVEVLVDENINTTTHLIDRLVTSADSEFKTITY